MSGLTKKQARILEYIRDFIGSEGFAPTFEEIATQFGISAATVHEHVRALERKGAIRTERNRSRSIEVVESPSRPSWRVEGRIAAGLPIEAVEDRFDMESFFASDRDCFLLEVKGQSMIEDHIQDGDYVMVERRETARTGETVVALIRGIETTLKRFFPEGDRVRLEPANAAMKPIIVPTDDVRVQGIVIGVLRRM